MAVLAKECHYEMVDRFYIGFGELPAGTIANVQVKGIKALAEIPSILVNPVFHIGKGMLEINGSVKTDEYLVYEEGSSAFVYDKNWNLLRELLLETYDYIMEKGWFKVWISAEGTDKPWLDVQFMTKGEPLVVCDEEVL